MQNVYNTAVIGGGAAGLFCASLLSKRTSVIILEKNSRLGRKLSVSGNGQGNITNADMRADFFRGDTQFISEVITKFTQNDLIRFFEEKGAVLCVREKNRVYPLSMQASSLCDILRHSLSAQNCQVQLNCSVTDLSKDTNSGIFTVTTQDKEKIYAQNVVLCAGGKAARHLGTDGGAYFLAQKFGHTITPLYPSLVQLRTNTKHIRGLKGVKVYCAAKAVCGSDVLFETQGDVLFTDYGISGNTVFELSAYVTHKENCRVVLNFFAGTEQERISSALLKKIKGGNLPADELFSGIMNKQLSRAVLKRAGVAKLNADIATLTPILDKILYTAYNFSLDITGNAGFDNAQVTKGGIKTDEIDAATMMSKLCKNLYFAGEIIDADGDCGGYNLQWAYSSAAAASQNILKNT